MEKLIRANPLRLITEIGVLVPCSSPDPASEPSASATHRHGIQHKLTPLTCRAYLTYPRRVRNATTLPIVKRAWLVGGLTLKTSSFLRI